MVFPCRGGLFTSLEAQATAQGCFDFRTCSEGALANYYDTYESPMLIRFSFSLCHHASRHSSSTSLLKHELSVSPAREAGLQGRSWMKQSRLSSTIDVSSSIDIAPC